MATPSEQQDSANAAQKSALKEDHVKSVGVDDDAKESSKHHGSTGQFSVRTASQMISKWKFAHCREHHARLHTDDAEYRRQLHLHERHLRSTVALPVISMMEAETLQILLEVEKCKDQLFPSLSYQNKSAYRYNLGQSHDLTLDAQRRIQSLREKTAAKGVKQEQKMGVMDTLRDCSCSLTFCLTGGATGQTEPDRKHRVFNASYLTVRKKSSTL
ncbi:uncharacterized protein LOC127437945 isoform X1 [Myxocyprinus asiaticus]|uniref:uncharacterized protein LOC127437945 isoform X1 n=1 Tax=Myxocyprinus asiaticus TaxID=70543 RepID=UPI00222134C3|nr:uncharacterized protein LOC127437945 isoform X1 [Myxocyprinus asiaticus]